MTDVVAVSQGIEENGRLSVGLTARRDERRSVPAAYSAFQPYWVRLKEVAIEK